MTYYLLILIDEIINIDKFRESRLFLSVLLFFCLFSLFRAFIILFVQRTVQSVFLSSSFSLAPVTQPWTFISFLFHFDFAVFNGNMNFFNLVFRCGRNLFTLILIEVVSGSGFSTSTVQKSQKKNCQNANNNNYHFRSIRFLLGRRHFRLCSFCIDV